MYFWSIIVQSLTAAVFLISGGVFGQERPALQHELQTAIVQLGNDDFALRQEASSRLWSAGKSAEPALTDALQSRDPEVAWRAAKILASFKYGLFPETPPQIANFLMDYRDADAITRRSLLQTITDPATTQAILTLNTLASAESNVDLKQAIAERLAQTAAGPASISTSAVVEAQAEDLREEADVSAESESNLLIEVSVEQPLLQVR